jgi:formamidase
MPKKVVSVDPSIVPWEQKIPLHNRWHPDIPAVATVVPDEIFRVECIDWTGGQIHNNDNSDDIKHVDLSQCHYLSGPIAIEGAERGDLLRVEICQIGPLEGYEWGYTGTFDEANGGGFLTDHYPSATKAIWDIEGIYCTSRHIPGVKFAGLIHPGLIGTAPSPELLHIWNTREKKLVHECDTSHAKTLCSHLKTRPLALLPLSYGAMLGSLGHYKAMGGKDSEWDRIANEAARTIPGRENGGNCDIKNLSRGCIIYFPVFVPGANLSMGDIHFSQGDGEVSFCGAIEMSGYIDLKCSIIKNGMKLLPAVGPSPLNVNPIFEIGPLEPRYSEWLVFEGISVDENGEQHFLDASIAYKRAVLNCIKYLSSNFGYTEEQIYLLLSCCPCEGRISGIVDIPNAVATLAIPLAIFDQDVRPPKTLETLASGIHVVKRGDVCKSVLGDPKPFDPRLPA